MLLLKRLQLSGFNYNQFTFPKRTYQSDYIKIRSKKSYSEK